MLPKLVWAIRARLGLASYRRDLVLFNVAIDSKLRCCDLVKLGVTDLVKDDRVREWVSVIQSKNKKPVQFALTENTRDTVIAWVGYPSTRCDRSKSGRCLLSHVQRFWCCDAINIARPVIRCWVTRPQ